jgi:hypothetical protein
VAFSIMIGLLIIGFVCNELIRPVHERYHEPAAEQTISPTGAKAA